MTLMTLKLAFQQQLKEMASNARYVGMEYHDHILLHFAFLMMSRSLTHFFGKPKTKQLCQKFESAQHFPASAAFLAAPPMRAPAGLR